SYFRITLLAARRAKGYHKTSGSGESTRRIILVARDFRPPLCEDAGTAGAGLTGEGRWGFSFFFRESQFHTVCRSQKGASGGNEPWTCTESGTRLVRAGSKTGAAALLARSTWTSKPEAGKYLARLRALCTPMPPAGGKR